VEREHPPDSGMEKTMDADDKVNILMVDDQPAKLLSYEVMLGELGENLIKAASAKEALEVLLRTDVAVVLMDVSMPELDGFELAMMIRQHPRFQRTAIIFISAVHLTDLDRLKGYEHGAVDYISVPVIQELLRAKVRVFAELHRKTRQLEALNRDLEHRVSERTEELASKAELLLKLNVELAGKNQELDAVVRTAPDVIFSSLGELVGLCASRGCRAQPGRLVPDHCSRRALRSGVSFAFQKWRLPLVSIACCFHPGFGWEDR
jgi:response regulator RpfG family c-di-GMP phosphodiesterase